MNNEADFQAIAQAVLPPTQGGWSKAWLTGEVSDDHTDLEFGYVAEDGAKTFVPAVLGRLKARDALKEVRKRMQRPGEVPWSRCTFNLFPDGRFKFDVEYDD